MFAEVKGASEVGMDKTFGAARIHQSLALTPLMVTSVLDVSTIGRVEEGTVARVGYTDAVALLCSDRLLAGLDLQTLPKCPFF